VDDLHYNTNLIVRGADLLASSAIQLFMSSFLKDNNFSNISFIHHELILQNHVKLSKSQMANPVKDRFSTPKHVYIYIGKLLGLPEKKSESLSLLLEHFKPNFNEDQKTKRL